MADGENYARGNRGGGRGRGNNNWRANRWRGYRRGRGSTRSDTNDRGMKKYGINWCLLCNCNLIFDIITIAGMCNFLKKEVEILNPVKMFS